MREDVASDVTPSLAYASGCDYCENRNFKTYASGCDCYEKRNFKKLGSRCSRGEARIPGADCFLDRTLSGGYASPNRSLGSLSA
jgi:hypothetical protein